MGIGRVNCSGSELNPSIWIARNLKCHAPRGVASERFSHTGRNLGYLITAHVLHLSVVRSTHTRRCSCVNKMKLPSPPTTSAGPTDRPRESTCCGDRNARTRIFVPALAVTVLRCRHRLSTNPPGLPDLLGNSQVEFWWRLHCNCQPFAILQEFESLVPDPICLNLDKALSDGRMKSLHQLLRFFRA